MKHNFLWQKYGLLISILCILILGATLVQAQTNAEEVALSGRVVKITTGESILSAGTEMQTQIVTVEITSNLQKGNIVTVSNTITDHPYYDLHLKVGDKVMLASTEIEGELSYYLTDYQRQTSVSIITGLFILSLIVIGGWKGVKAIISLLVMGSMILLVMLPLILRGYNAVLVTVGLCGGMTTIFLFFIGGLNRKSLAATIGTVGGLICSGLLALIAGQAAYLTGLSSSEAQLLQFSTDTLNFPGLLFSGMILGALGAIIDVSMSVASAMEQIKEAAPETDFKTLFSRGLNVGRDMLGTMSNTLILAYVGSSLPLLLLFLTDNTPWATVINMDMIATEIIRSMAGSIGLALAIPLTSLGAGLLMAKKQKNTTTDNFTS